MAVCEWLVWKGGGGGGGDLCKTIVFRSKRMKKKCFYSEFHALHDHQKTVFLFELALPFGIEHSIGQPGTSLFYKCMVY